MRGVVSVVGNDHSFGGRVDRQTLWLADRRHAFQTHSSRQTAPKRDGGGWRRRSRFVAVNCERRESELHLTRSHNAGASLDGPPEAFDAVIFRNAYFDSHQRSSLGKESTEGYKANEDLRASFAYLHPRYDCFLWQKSVISIWRSTRAFEYISLFEASLRQSDDRSAFFRINVLVDFLLIFLSFVCALIRALSVRDSGSNDSCECLKKANSVDGVKGHVLAFDNDDVHDALSRRQGHQERFEGAYDERFV